MALPILNQDSGLVNASFIPSPTSLKKSFKSSHFSSCFFSLFLSFLSTVFSQVLNQHWIHSRLCAYRKPLPIFTIPHMPATGKPLVKLSVIAFMYFCYLMAFSICIDCNFSGLCIMMSVDVLVVGKIDLSLNAFYDFCYHVTCSSNNNQPSYISRS